MRKPRPGDEVKVTFIDHVLSEDQEHVFIVYGRIHHIDDLSITLDAWADPDDTTKETWPRYALQKASDRHDSDDLTTFTLIRSTVLRLTSMGEIEDLRK